MTFTTFTFQRTGLGQYWYHQWIKHYTWISIMCLIYSVWYMKKYTYGSTNLFHYFQPSRCPHVSIWKAFTKAHHLLINKSFRNMPIYMSWTLCKINIFHVNDGTYRFWANCVLGKADIHMLVVAVVGGPIWSIIKVPTAELMGDARSVTLAVYSCRCWWLE